MAKKRPKGGTPPPAPSAKAADALLPAFARLFAALVRNPTTACRALRGDAAFESYEALLATLPFVLLTLAFLLPVAGARRIYPMLKPEFLRWPLPLWLGGWATSVLVSPFAFHEAAERLGGDGRREPTVAMASMVLIGYALLRLAFAFALGLPPRPSWGDAAGFLPAALWAGWAFQRHARAYYDMPGPRAYAAASVMIALGVVLPALLAAGAASVLP